MSEEAESSKQNSLPEENLKEIEKAIGSQLPGFNKLNPQKKQEVLQWLTSFTVFQQKSHSGPIPPPETLDKYEEILPGATERIFKMAEKQQDHRQNLESIAIPSQIQQSARGQLFAFILGLVGLLSALILGLYGHTKLAGTIGCGTVISLAAIFVTGKYITKKDLEKKKKD